MMPIQKIERCAFYLAMINLRFMVVKMQEHGQQSGRIVE